VGLAAYPGFSNYPNLLARVFIIANLQRTDTLARYYQIHSKLVPNLAFDMVGPFLVDLGMSVEQAGKLFVALTIFTFCGGTLYLAYAAQRRPPWLALGIFAFALNGYLGLLNYIFGIGLAFAALALWLLRKRETAWTAYLFSALPCLLLVCHLIAFTVYALAIACFALCGYGASSKQADGQWKLLREALHFVPALLIYAFFFEHRGTLGISYEDPLTTKLDGLYAVFSTADGRGWDFALIAMLAAAAAFLWSRAGLAFSSRGAAEAILTLLASFVLAPYFLLGFWVFDSRLALPLVCFVLAFTQVRDLSMLTPRAASFMMLGLFAIVLQKSAATFAQWQLASESFTQLRHAMALIEEGARVATIVRRNGSGGEPRPAQTAASFAIIDHLAFVPELDAFPLSQDSVEFTKDVLDDVWHFRDLAVNDGAAFDWTRQAGKFDYVLYLAGGQPAEAPAAFRRVADGNGFVLLSTHPTRPAEGQEPPAGSDSIGSGVVIAH
jgi:hypothetical protein